MKNYRRLLVLALILISSAACGRAARNGLASNRTCYSGPSSAFNDSESRTDSGNFDICYDNSSLEGTGSFVDGQTSQTPVAAKVSGAIIDFEAHACSGDTLRGRIDTSTGNTTFSGTVCVLTYSNGQARVSRSQL